MRLDAGYQIFGPRDPAVHGWAGSLFAGWNRYNGNFASDLLEKLGGNASRWDLDALFITGRQWNDYLHTYFGARYMLSRWSLQLVPSLPLVYDSGEVQQNLLGTDEAGTIHQFGALAGIAVGYKQAFVGLELNAVYYATRVRLLFEDERARGVAIMPSVYVFGRY